MNDSELENKCGLLIEQEELFRIREACRQRRAELEASGTLPPATIAPGTSQSASSAAPASLPMSEAERFAAAVLEMPARIRAFFEHEDPAPYRQPESRQDRLEVEARASFGGWCG
jgi:hypothetical protein